MAMRGPKPRNPAFAKTFGRNLAHHRDALGVSQEDLGLMADLHRTAVGQLERGERVPRADTVVKLCSCLNVSSEDLFRGLSWTPAIYTEGTLVATDEDDSAGG